MADPKVLAAQRFINDTYTGVAGIPQVTEDGITGWATMYALTRCLQKELGITALSDSFGPTTLSTLTTKYPAISTTTTTVPVNINKIIKAALYCKGYDGGETAPNVASGQPDYLKPEYSARVAAAVQKLKTDAGATGLGAASTVVPKVFKALLTMDAYVTVPGGSSSIRTIQQWMNTSYVARRDFFVIPCDGIFSRDVQKALMLAIQFELGMTDDQANGTFGPSTQAGIKTHTLAVGSTGRWVQLFSAGMVFNQRSGAVFTATFDSALSTRVNEFQAFVKLPVTGKGDYPTWASLLVSTGDNTRKGTAADCVDEVTDARAKALKAAGYKVIGRYLSNVPGSSLNKKIRPGELLTIAGNGLSVFPIYQTYGGAASYFGPYQGASDALTAIDWAKYYGFKSGTRIYFAVDFDAIDGEVTSNVIPHFSAIKSVFDDYSAGYKIGIYGPRNACSRVAAAGLTTASFVSDMSTGYSGNLGFPMPANWAFDQISTITVGSGTGQINIDNDIVSGVDNGQTTFNAGGTVANLDVDFDKTKTAAMLADVKAYLSSQGVPETGGSIGEDIAQVYSTTQAFNQTLYFDSVLTGLARQLRCRKALIMVPIMWEIRKFNVLDAVADDGVVRYYTGTDFDPTDKWIKPDCSTGLGQIFAATAINSRNYMIQQGLVTGTIKNPSSEGDLWPVWQKLHNDDVYNINTAAHVLFQKSVDAGIPKPSLTYTVDQSRQVLQRYQGTTDKAVADGYIKAGLYQVLEKYFAPLRNV